jgi:hypothetical protein
MSVNSAVVIARLLGTEGFTDHLGNQIEKYWRTRSGLTHRQQRQIEKLDKAVAEMTAKLDVKERLALGRFIGLHKKMSFDTGLRIGLTAFQLKCESASAAKTTTAAPRDSADDAEAGRVKLSGVQDHADGA